LKNTKSLNAVLGYTKVLPNTPQYACGQSCSAFGIHTGSALMACTADNVAGPAADKEESSHRVLLLASQGCLGGAEEHTGDQAMDSRAVKSLWCLFGSLMMIVIFGKTVDEM